MTTFWCRNRLGLSLVDGGRLQSMQSTAPWLFVLLTKWNIAAWPYFPKEWWWVHSYWLKCSSHGECIRIYLVWGEGPSKNAQSNCSTLNPLPENSEPLCASSRNFVATLQTLIPTILDRWRVWFPPVNETLIVHVRFEYRTHDTHICCLTRTHVSFYLPHDPKGRTP